MTFKQMIRNITPKQDTSITIGNFDGIHLGHQSLIQETIRQAEKKNLLSMVFTYSIHPLEYIYHKKIKTIDDPVFKETLLQGMGIGQVLSVPFDDTIMRMSSKAFVEEILMKELRCRCLIMGEDSMLGKDREGKAASIAMMGRELGLGVYLVPLVHKNGMRISSSYIRSLIERGKMEEAQQYLGRPFSLAGNVVEGKQNGKKFGVPTANLKVSPDIVIPGRGVYYTRVKIGSQIFSGATSVGTNPTIARNNQLSVEVHILDFDQDLYGQEIRVYFIKKLRDEMKFTSFRALKQQMEKDIMRVRKAALL